MYSGSHTIISATPIEAAYALCSDVNAWPRWDHALLAIELDGDFVTGSSGHMTLAGQPSLPFTLTDVVQGHGFTDVTEVPGVATLTFDHQLVALPDGTQITHTITITGPVADELGPMVSSDTPEAMAALALLAEQSPALTA